MEATVNVTCYKSKVLKNGESPLMVRICKNGKKKYKSLGISVNPVHWDFKKNLPKPKCPNYEALLILINEKINEFQRIILDKKVNNVEFTATTLLQSTDTLQSKHLVSVGEGFLNYIQALKKLRTGSDMQECLKCPTHLLSSSTSILTCHSLI